MDVIDRTAPSSPLRTTFREFGEGRFLYLRLLLRQIVDKHVERDVIAWNQSGGVFGEVLTCVFERFELFFFFGLYVDEEDVRLFLFQVGEDDVAEPFVVHLHQCVQSCPELDDVSVLDACG